MLYFRTRLSYSHGAIPDSDVGGSLDMANYPDSAGSASALIGLFQFLNGGLVAPLAGIGGGDTALPMALLIACLGVGALLVSSLLAGSRVAPVLVRKQ